VPLNGAGVKQANMMKIENTFDAAYHSGLHRSEKTLEILLHNIVFNKPSKQSDLLKERRYGIFEGLTHDEVSLKYTTTYNSWKIDSNTNIPGGESEEDVLSRIKSFLRLVSNSEDANLVVVTHSGFMQILYKFLFDIKTNVGDYLHIDNCEFYKLNYNITGDVIEFQFIHKLHNIEDVRLM
tara:strand:+ start:1599 stop:2141 length:543 start_codon:yes stop_codon:yes gene_type:complete